MRKLLVFSLVVIAPLYGRYVSLQDNQVLLKINNTSGQRVTVTSQNIKRTTDRMRLSAGNDYTVTFAQSKRTFVINVQQIDNDIMVTLFEQIGSTSKGQEPLTTDLRKAITLTIDKNCNAQLTQ